jgi:hypothetical protein
LGAFRGSSLNRLYNDENFGAEQTQVTAKRLRILTLGETLAILGMIGGAIAAIGAAIGFAFLHREEIGKAHDWWRDDAALTGTWSNDGEGSVDAAEWAAKTPDDIASLSIDVKDGKIEGTIHTPRLCAFQPWNYTRFQGTNTWWQTTWTATATIMGENVKLGTFSMQTNDDGFLIMTPSGSSRTFPGTLKLARIDPSPTDEQQGVAQQCSTGFIEMLKQQRQRRSPTGK